MRIYVFLLLTVFTCSASDRLVEKYLFKSEQVRDALGVVFTKGSFVEEYGDEVIEGLTDGPKTSGDVFVVMKESYGKYAKGRGAKLTSLSFRVSLMHKIAPGMLRQLIGDDAEVIITEAVSDDLRKKKCVIM